MKLKSVKNIVIVTGCLTLGMCSSQELKANPVRTVEKIIITAFCEAQDQRCFNKIIDEITTLIRNNYDHFKNMVHAKVSNPDGFIQEFIQMLEGLKKKTNAMEIVTELNRYKRTFDILMPNVMRKLLQFPLKTLNNLKETLKRN